MKNKTLETALLYLSGGCLVISVLEIFSRGLAFGYLWLMICVLLFLGYTILKRRRVAREQEEQKPMAKNIKPVQGAGQTKSSVSKSRRKRR